MSTVSFAGRLAVDLVRRLLFVPFLLSKDSDRLSRLPERIVQRSIEFWSMFDTNGFGRFRSSRFHLGLRVCILWDTCRGCLRSRDQSAKCAQDRAPLVKSTDHVAFARIS